MRSFILIAFIVSLSLNAQEKVSPSFTLEGKLTKVVTYHENGEIAQTGFLKKNKLHGKWASFSETGEKLLWVPMYWERKMDSGFSGRKII